MQTGTPAIAQAATLTPDILIISADVQGLMLLPLVCDLHVATPRSRLLVLGSIPTLDSVTIMPLARQGLASYLVWEEIGPETIARCVLLLAHEDLLVDSPAVWQELLASLERRRGPRLDTADHKTARSVLAAPAPLLRATLWEENPDLTEILRTVFALASIDLCVVQTGEALLAAAVQARPGDFLVIDCSLALPGDMGRCSAIVTRTAVPVHIIHPRPYIIDAVKDVALGPVAGLIPDQAGLALLEQLRLLAAAAPTPLAHPTLTAREMEVWRLLAARLRDAQIATQLGVSTSTVKTNVMRIKVKLGQSSRAALIDTYHRSSAG